MTMKYITIFITLAILSNNVLKAEDSESGPLVETEGGPVQGRIAKTFSGRRYISFQGIPYARPPVGSLRFKAPQPAEPWPGVLNASAPGFDCPQLDRHSGNVTGNEDCLTLNVYTTQLDGKPQPVLVWLHGGSFINGSGRLYQPDVLLEHGLVVVTLNYRLGALGFLCWPRAGIPGNMGLRDQSLALHWVRRNVAEFGGDAASVTLAGQSAGAAAVILHMLSPLSKGLFDRALSMSGSALSWWATTGNPEERAQRLLRAAGLSPDVKPGDYDDAVLLSAFLASSAAGPDVLVPRYRDALDPQEWVEPILPVLAACVEHEAEACVGAFLPNEPWRLLSAGRFHHVPLLAGLTDGEAKFFLLFGGMGSNDALQVIDQNFDRLFSPIKNAALIARIRNFYFGSEPITEESLMNLTNLLSDVHVLEPMERTLRVVAQKQRPHVFLYLLTHQPRHSFWGTPLQLIDSLGVPGVPHGEELAALFPLLPGEPPDGQRVPEDDRVRHFFATAVANFARTGNPVPKTNDLMKEKWAPFTLEDQAFMNISSSPNMQKNIMADRIEFWRQLLADMEAKPSVKKQPNDAAATTDVQCLLKLFICSLMIAAFLQ